jgi:hypothetical protein
MIKAWGNIHQYGHKNRVLIGSPNGKHLFSNTSRENIINLGLHSQRYLRTIASKSDLEYQIKISNDSKWLFASGMSNVLQVNLAAKYEMKEYEGLYELG